MRNTKNRETIEQIEARLAKNAAAEKARVAKITEGLRQQAEDRRLAKQAAKIKREQDAAKARETAAAKRFDLQRKRTALSAWRANGGTLAEFEESWPEMRREMMTNAVMEGQDRRQRATERSYKERI